MTLSPVCRRFAASLLPAVVLLAVPFVPVTAAGQVPEKFENLEVLPRDIPRDSLLQIMRGFTFALGVRCQYCHVAAPEAGDGAGANGRSRERLVFKSDDKAAKRNARFMLRMVDSLNHVVLANLPDRSNPPVRIECVTCHRGSPVPQTLQTALTAVIDRYGIDSAVARYKQMRQDMESGRYDVSEESVNDLARSLSERGETDQAIAILQMNQEFHPDSPGIDFALGELYLRRGEKDKAIERYRRVLTRQPNNVRAKRRLEELGATPGDERSR